MNMVSVLLLCGLAVQSVDRDAELDSALQLLADLDRTSFSVEYDAQRLDDVIDDLGTRSSIPVRAQNVARCVTMAPLGGCRASAA